jgi:hypothetical protein
MADRPVFNNFDLHIGMASDHAYPLSVLYSPAGETAEPVPVAMAYNDQTMTNWLTRLSRLAVDRDGLVALGRRLASYLLPAGQVRDLYQRSLGLTEAKQLNLRIRLRISPPELAALPWEFAYDDSVADFFVLNPRTVLVRYHSEPVSPLPVTSHVPVPLLVLVSNPSGSQPIAAIQETCSLLEALDQFLRTGRVTVDILCSVTAEDRQKIAEFVTDLPGVRLLAGMADVDNLRATLHRGYRVLHYIGHGGFDAVVGGALLLVSSDGTKVLVGAQALVRELRGSTVAVLVLNACQSATEDTAPALMGLAPNLIRAGIPAVVAMQYSIPDASAVHFSRSLYGALADGWPLDAAVTEGRKAISAHTAEDSMEWGIPVLFMRSPDGVIWQEGQTMDEEKAVPETESGVSQGGVVFRGTTTFGGDFVQGNKTVSGGEVYGDKIETHIGAIGPGAQTVIGKQRQVTQTMTQRERDLSPVDRAEIELLMAQLREALAQADAPEGKKSAGQEFVGQLEAELTKTGEIPDGNMIKLAGDWLLKNVPTLAGALASVFLNPIVGKVVEAAGDVAAGWVKQRFGSGS